MRIVNAASAWYWPDCRKPRYCGTRMTPCESCPHRLASTRLFATSDADSGGTPAAVKRADTNSDSGCGENVGIGRVPDFRIRVSTDIVRIGLRLETWNRKLETGYTT